jgi:hypothetical protein
MPRTVGKDKHVERFNSAASKGSAKGSGSAGGVLKQVEFTPGVSTIYSRKSKASNGKADM